MSTNLIPAEVFPPGEILREELEARGWSQADLAAILGRPPRLISEVISGKRTITPETAQGLGDAFGIDPQFWLNLESAYQLSRVRNPDSRVAKRAKLFEKAPINELVRRHWIEATNDVDELEARVLRFLGISSLDEEPAAWAHAARKSSSYSHITPAQRAWLCRSRQLARAVHAQPYSESRFGELMERLRLLLVAPEEARHAPQLLAEYGVRLIIVEPLAGTKIDGVCFWLDANSPVIALSLRFDRLDAFWFTLFHELGHVKVRDGLKSAVAIDDNIVGQGATRFEDKSQSERNADQLAMEAIIPKAKLDSFVSRVRPLYSKDKIRSFAIVNGIHPGLVVGQLQYRGEISYAHNREMLARIRDIVTKSALTDGWGATPVIH